MSSSYAYNAHSPPNGLWHFGQDGAGVWLGDGDEIGVAGNGTDDPLPCIVSLACVGIAVWLVVTVSWVGAVLLVCPLPFVVSLTKVGAVRWLYRCCWSARPWASGFGCMVSRTFRKRAEAGDLVGAATVSVVVLGLPNLVDVVVTVVVVVDCTILVVEKVIVCGRARQILSIPVFIVLVKAQNRWYSEQKGEGFRVACCCRTRK